MIAATAVGIRDDHPPGHETLLAELAREIGDARVMAAMADVPRDECVPRRLRHRAWENEPLAIGRGQTISQPLVVARMCVLLGLSGDEVVLDVGTGSGYHAAVLSRLAGRVITIERHRELSAWAAANLRRAGYSGVEVVVGDGSLGWAAGAPYDAINVAAACAGAIPPALEEQLAPGGRLVIPADAADQRLVLVRRAGDAFTRERLDRVRFVPLVQPD